MTKKSCLYKYICVTALHQLYNIYIQNIIPPSHLAQLSHSAFLFQ